MDTSAIAVGLIAVTSALSSKTHPPTAKDMITRFLCVDPTRPAPPRVQKPGPKLSAKTALYTLNQRRSVLIPAALLAMWVFSLDFLMRTALTVMWLGCSARPDLRLSKSYLQVVERLGPDHPTSDETDGLWNLKRFSRTPNPVLHEHPTGTYLRLPERRLAPTLLQTVS